MVAGLAAVLCARSLRNGGMYSVDRTASPFVTSCGVVPALCRTQGQSHWGAYRYDNVREWQDLDKYDALFFWGDWQTHPKYGAEDYLYAEKKYQRNPSSDDGLRRWRQIYQLGAMSNNDTRPIITLGTSFVGLTDALRDPEAAGNFERYIARSSLVFPRCAQSLRELKALFPAAKNIMAGIDPSLLSSAQYVMRFKPRGLPTFSYCFDRELRHVERQIVKLIAAKTRAKPVYIDWNRRYFPRRMNERRFQRNLDALQATDFCVTDLYHLSANALKLGMPVICCGQDMPGSTVTTSALKKRSLMETLAVPELYAHLDDGTLTSIEQCLESLHRPDVNAKVAGLPQVLAAETERIRGLVIEALARP